MSESKRPEIVNVEKYFNEFVEFCGGKIISGLEQNLVDRPNADYLFEKNNIIAELKCFQKDLFSKEDDIPRIENFLYDWEKRKLISQEDKIKLVYGKMQLPNECYLDLLRSCKRTIDRAIHKANKQIKETKKTFSLPNSKGVIFLANDGNYFAQSPQFLSIIGDLLHSKYLQSEIDCFVYFTVNQVSRLENDQREWVLWVPGYRDESDETLSSFINDLGFKFHNEFFTKKTGLIPDSRFHDGDPNILLDTIGQLKYVPKHIIYKKKE